MCYSRLFTQTFHFQNSLSLYLFIASISIFQSWTVHFTCMIVFFFVFLCFVKIFIDFVQFFCLFLHYSEGIFHFLLECPSIILMRLHLRLFSSTSSGSGCSGLVVPYWSLCWWMHSHTAICPSLPPVGAVGACASGGPYSSLWWMWNMWLMWSLFL